MLGSGRRLRTLFSRAPSALAPAAALTQLSYLVVSTAGGCEIDTGDGAGAIFTLPHEFLKRVVKEDCGKEVRPQSHAQLSMALAWTWRHSPLS